MRGKTFVDKGARLTDMFPTDNSKNMSVHDPKQKRRMTMLRPMGNNSTKNALGFSLPESSRPFTPSGYGKKTTAKKGTKFDDHKSDLTSELDSDLMNSNGSPLKTLKIYNQERDIELKKLQNKEDLEKFEVDREEVEHMIHLQKQIQYIEEEQLVDPELCGQAQMELNENISKEIREDRNGNVDISLYWQEKFLLIWRYVQFYAFFFIVNIEYWPLRIKGWASYLFFFASGSWHLIIGGDPIENYYDMITSQEILFYVSLGVAVVALTLIILGMVIFLHKPTYYRLLMVHKKFNWHKTYFYIFELLFFPLLTNASYSMKCSFITGKQYYTPTTCPDQNMYYVQNLVGLGMLVLAVIYILMHFYWLYTQKVSHKEHGAYLRQKEVEYTLGINTIWQMNYFWSFSSFRGTFFKMYYRAYFNIFALIFIIIYVGFEKEQVQISLSTYFLIFMQVNAMFARPYRSLHTNGVYVILNLQLFLTSLMAKLKIDEYPSSLLADAYYGHLWSSLNAFGLACILTFLGFQWKNSTHWDVDKDYIVKVMTDCEIAIIQVKAARMFKERLLRTKRFNKADKKELDMLIEQLTGEFDKLRAKQAFIMDSILETLDYLRENRRNYQQDPNLYNFDYKKELINIAKNRDKVFSFKEVQDKLESSDEEEDDSEMSSQSTDRERLNKKDKKKSGGLPMDSRDDIAKTSVSSKM